MPPAGSGQAGELHASLQSPDGRLSWMLHADNRAAHSLKKGNRTVLEPSGLGIVVNGQGPCRRHYGMEREKSEGQRPRHL